MHNHTHELTLGLAFFLGALHALEPGHGKTTMLVYLSGERRSIWHPVVIGLSSAVSHSVSLVAIALGVHLTHHLVSGDHLHENHQVSTTLQWISAALVLCVGGWLGWTAIRHKPARCGCHEHHTEGCGSVSRRKAASYSRSALLGVAFGLLPCPSALAAYFASMSAGTPVAAYAVVGLFAAGIACSLTVIGILLQYFAGQSLRGSEWLRRLPWPHLRAALIFGIGLFYLGRLVIAA